jgi:hypothetical protein
VPVQGETIGVIPVKGVVDVKLPGKRAVRLIGKRIVPVGSTVDTTRGKVIVQYACPRCARGARIQSGTFSGGLFRVTQPHNRALTTLTLNGPLRRCVGTSRGAGFRRIARYLVGQARNARFKVAARYAIASTRRASWLIVDYCTRTFVAAGAGSLTVTDRRRGRSIRLKAGRVVSIVPPGRALPLGSGCCTTPQSEGALAAATPIALADGTTASAGTLTAGDVVNSANGSSAEILYAGHANGFFPIVVYIRLEDGRQLVAAPGTEVVTENGPEQANQLGPGDVVETAEGTATVAQVASGSYTRPMTALAVGGNGAFFANGVLVFGMTG